MTTEKRAEEIGKVLAAHIEKLSADPMQLLSKQDALRRVARRYKARMHEVETPLYDAVYYGHLVMLQSAVQGRHLSRLRRHPKPEIHRFQWDGLVDDENDAPKNADFILDSTGYIHRGKETRLTYDLPDGHVHADEDSVWVTTPARFQEILQALREMGWDRSVRQGAERLTRNALIEALSDDIDQIAGLLWLAGIKNPGSVWVWANEKGVQVDLSTKGEEQIRALAEILRKAGIPTDTNWRKFV
ncbi:hypothetical protein FDA94_28880 [Herbidospora galbida]|uniref:Uncharacterized protein n=1 Tax=Herbidospora galbida TaxID=2575442 RepID=A0A4U3MAE7_9ACTN|nr:hypothetical protein [Herbidospora galbida]TKK84647.1 hypothetical protein FDA94_28880 [Herbidospora galbida]